MPSVNIIPQKNTITAEQVVKEMHHKQNQNELGLNKNYKLLVNTSITMDKNNAVFYRFNGKHSLIKPKDKELYAYLKDTINKTQKTAMDTALFSIASARPSYFLNFLFMPASTKKDKAKYYDYKMGEIDFYEGELVYHVKFHRKAGGGYCESGGFYLISKETFAVLYVEMIAKSCHVTTATKDKESLMIDYHHIKVWFSKQLPPLYNRYKIEEVAKYTSKNINGTSNRYYKESTIRVEEIEEVQIPLTDLVPATKIFD